MPNAITPAQQTFLEGLRTGDHKKSGIKIEPFLSEGSREDIIRFKQFLVAYGHPNPQPDDLYLIVNREDFLSLLHYADDRECLGLQCCFGFDTPPTIDVINPSTVPLNVPERVIREVGQVLLVQKGNFQQIDSANDDDFFNQDTVFRNQYGTKELFRDMDLNQSLSENQAKTFLDNFRAIYPADNTARILGYLLPVKAFLSIFSDSSQPLGSVNRLTFRWGLTGLGNFSLIIGTDDFCFDPTIELGKDILGGVGDPELPPCPPTPGCES